MVIELCGNPGCGKTTVANALKQRLEEEGYSVINVHNRKPLKSLKSRITHYMHAVAYRRYKKTKSLKRELVNYSKKNPCDGARIWINCILENIYSTDKYMKCYDIVLADEGCIQFLSSMVHKNQLTDDIGSVMSILRRIHYMDTYVFRCSVSKDVNIERLVNRNRKGDRCLSGSRQEIAEQLILKQKNIDKACSYLSGLNVYSVDTADKDRAVDLIMRYLKTGDV